MDNFYEHHVLHSLAVAKAIQFVPGTRILDIGTGGGFPGVPLAIMFPEVEFLLVDSVGKKLRVIDDIAAQIGLTNVKTLHERAENVPGTFDFATSRAVTRLDTAWGWASNKISLESKNSLKNGLLYLKGGDISDELPKGVQLERFELNEWFNEPYFSEKSLVHIYSGV
jgi:16S rRNA (guanine527-N7)-methyltransferase